MTTTTRQIRQTGVITEDLGSTMTRANHVDTYSTFDLGDEAWSDRMNEWFSETAGVDMDSLLIWWQDVEIRYDNAGWIKRLAAASIEVIRDRLPDDTVVKAVEMTGETWSPREYNFTTDGYMARWTVDADALDAWLAAEGITLSDGRGISGFIRTADDDVWYLSRGLEEYLERHFEDQYFTDMLERVSEDQDNHVEVWITEDGLAKIAAAGGDISKLPSGPVGLFEL